MILVSVLLALSLVTPEVATIPHRNKDTKSIYLEVEAATAFREMAASAAKEGIELIPISGYRTQKEQAYLYRKHGPIRAAPPGFSSHELGLAVDIHGVERFIHNDDVINPTTKCTLVKFGWNCPTLTYWWLARNANKFGFVQTVDYELWHWKYIKANNEKLTRNRNRRGTTSHSSWSRKDHRLFQEQH